MTSTPPSVLSLHTAHFAASFLSECFINELSSSHRNQPPSRTPRISPTAAMLRVPMAVLAIRSTKRTDCIAFASCDSLSVSCRCSSATLAINKSTSSFDRCKSDLSAMFSLFNQSSDVMSLSVNSRPSGKLCDLSDSFAIRTAEVIIAATQALICLAVGVQSAAGAAEPKMYFNTGASAAVATSATGAATSVDVSTAADVTVATSTGCTAAGSVAAATAATCCSLLFAAIEK